MKEESRSSLSFAVIILADYDKGSHPLPPRFSRDCARITLNVCVCVSREAYKQNGLCVSPASVWMIMMIPLARRGHTLRATLRREQCEREDAHSDGRCGEKAAEKTKHMAKTH